MNAGEFISQQIKAGYKVHFHEGVWWRMVGPFFCKPVFPLQSINPGEAKPKFSESFLGYSHLVAKKELANKNWSVMLLNQDKLNKFSLTQLDSSKRARIRKGLRLTEVKRISSVDSIIDDFKQVVISTAERTHYGRPPSYYVRNEKKWSSYIKTLFGLPDREWWGCFCNGRLIAYLYSYLIEDTMFIDTAKSHSAFLDKCPNDALRFKFLEYCKGLSSCRQVIDSDYSFNKPTLNEYKEKFGFERENFPVYARYNHVLYFVKRTLSKLLKLFSKNRIYFFESLKSK